MNWPAPPPDLYRKLVRSLRREGRGALFLVVAFLGFLYGTRTAPWPSLAGLIVVVYAYDRAARRAEDNEERAAARAMIASKLDALAILQEQLAERPEAAQPELPIEGGGPQERSRSPS